MKKDVDKLCERLETLKHSLASAVLVNIQYVCPMGSRKQLLTPYKGTGLLS